MTHPKHTDMTPVVELTNVTGAGPRRSKRPVYVDLLPPCNAACPAGEDIQAWMAHAQAGNFRAATGPHRRGVWNAWVPRP
jgi:hypothetical protein